MNKSRLEAFSDGVFAIIITVMVLELKVPGSAELAALAQLAPQLYCYLLSFIFIAIYWGNHHHLMHTVKRVNAAIIWANMHLLFWLSLVPIATGWMGGNCFAKNTVAVYGALLLLCGVAYTILMAAIKNGYHEETQLTQAIAGNDRKGWVSILLYGASIPIALYGSTAVAEACFVAVAIMWIVPSKAIEKALRDLEH